MKLIDTHAHIYLDSFKNDIEQVMTRALAAGVEKIYLPAIDRSETQKIFNLEMKYPGVCVAMAGLHPCSVNENYEGELTWIEEMLNSRHFAAVGEIGLDFHWDKTFVDQQYDAFERQVEWALKYDLPIVIHSRDAIDECIATIAKFTSRGVKGIFHCFGGNLEQARAIIGMGMYLGIGGVITYKNAGLAEVLEEVSLEHLVLETDAPYLTPVPFRGKRNESSYLKYVAEKLALVKRVSLEEVAAVTTANAEKIFGA